MLVHVLPMCRILFFAYLTPLLLDKVDQPESGNSPDLKENIRRCRCVIARRTDDDKGNKRKQATQASRQTRQQDDRERRNDEERSKYDITYMVKKAAQWINQSDIVRLDLRSAEYLGCSLNMQVISDVP